jgi:hypothetical protein
MRNRSELGLAPKPAFHPSVIFFVTDYRLAIGRRWTNCTSFSPAARSAPASVGACRATGLRRPWAHQMNRGRGSSATCRSKSADCLQLDCRAVWERVLSDRWVERNTLRKLCWWADLAAKGLPCRLSLELKQYAANLQSDSVRKLASR